MTEDSQRRSARADPMRTPVDRLYVVAAFGIEASLVVFFALRMWAFDTALQVGWIVYALAVPALGISIALIRAGRPASFWFAGVAYAAWAVVGYIVDVANPIDWRQPILWQVFVPYVALYLAAQMFYWWPLGRIDRRLWIVFTVLFVISTVLNIASHA